MFFEIGKGVRGGSGGDDGIPDDGFRGTSLCGAGLVRGGIGRVDVDEELLGVPVKEGSQVGVEVEADLGIFFTFCRVVMGSAFDAAG